jgi:hypothetical protein
LRIESLTISACPARRTIPNQQSNRQSQIGKSANRQIGNRQIGKSAIGNRHCEQSAIASRQS